MNILIGVCGIGYGHCTRQLEISKALKKRGHNIRILTFANGISVFKECEFNVHEVWVPWVAYKKGNLNILTTIKKNFFSFLPGLIQNKKIYKELLNDDFIPDVCITDYEPITAKISYKLKKPLIIIDQQSKFWHFDFEPINSFSCNEEKKRLNMFFPKYTKRFIISAYKLPIVKDKKVQIIPPILRGDIKNIIKKEKNNILVYFSKYGTIGINQPIEKVVKILSNIKQNYKFILYLPKEEKVKFKDTGNIEFHQIDRSDFAENLSYAKGIITTAGHTLISEALYLDIPVYSIPLPTFDQHYCSKYINDNKLGFSSYSITKIELTNFIANLDKFKQNISDYKNKIFNFDPIDPILKYIEEGTYE